MDYRKINDKELTEGTCLICNNPTIYLDVHHIDGNKKNDKKENLLVCCNVCHKLIHNGLTNLQRNLPKEVIDKIKFYRKIILFKKYRNKKKTEEILDYEDLIRTQSVLFIQKNRCYICHKKKDIRYFCHPLIKKYSSNPKKFSTPICKICLKGL